MQYPIDAGSRHTQGLPSGSAVKSLPANAGDTGLIPGLGRFPGEGTRNPLQYSCLENPMDRGAWWAAINGVAKSHTQLNMHTCRHPQIYKHTHICIQFLKFFIWGLPWWSSG